VKILKRSAKQKGGSSNVAKKKEPERKSAIQRTKEYEEMKAAIWASKEFGTQKGQTKKIEQPPILQGLLSNGKGKGQVGVGRGRGGYDPDYARGRNFYGGHAPHADARFAPNGVYGLEGSGMRGVDNVTAAIGTMNLSQDRKKSPVKTRVILQSDGEHHHDPDFNRRGVRLVEPRHQAVYRPQQAPIGSSMVRSSPIGPIGSQIGSGAQYQTPYASFHQPYRQFHPQASQHVHSSAPFAQQRHSYHSQPLESTQTSYHNFRSAHPFNRNASTFQPRQTFVPSGVPSDRPSHHQQQPQQSRTPQQSIGRRQAPPVRSEAPAELNGEDEFPSLR